MKEENQRSVGWTILGRYGVGVCPRGSASGPSLQDPRQEES